MPIKKVDIQSVEDMLKATSETFSEHFSNVCQTIEEKGIVPENADVVLSMPADMLGFIRDMTEFCDLNVGDFTAYINRRRQKNSPEMN